MRSNAGIDALRVAVGSRGYAYMELSTLGGEWINMGAVAVGSRDVDFFNAATLRRTIDDNTWSLSAQFAREVGVGSLSPFRTDSVVNVEDGSYAPLADLHRRWRLWVAAPTPLTFRELARGWTDKITISGDQAVITIEGRGEEADLIDRRIIFVDPTADPPVPITSDTPKSYASGALEDVLQAILDDHLGPGVVTLTVDSSAPAFFVNGWDQTTDVGLFDLLTQVAGLAGASVAYRYDDDDVLSLTLFTPNRAPTTPDWTTNARAYERLEASIDKQPIRNYVVVKYVDDTFGVQVVTSPTTPASASITRYGLRPLVIDLASSTQITDQTSAGNLADAICADLEFPAIEQDLTEVNAWFGELWDYVRTDANGVHYNEDQFGGVTSVSHVFQNGMLRSSFGLRGKPAGGYRRWLNFGTGAPRVPFTPEITNLTASFKQQLDVLGGGTLLPAVFTAATVNQYARSVTFELSAALDFAVVIDTQSVDVVDGTAETGWVGSGFVTAGTDYYVRATPYSGVLSGDDPTGVAGEFVVANTRTLPKPTDTPSLEWDTSDPTELKANVPGLDTIDSDLTALSEEPFTVWDDTLGLPNARKWVDGTGTTVNTATPGEIAIDVTGGGGGAEAANTVYAGPTSGGSATPTFRALVAADIPSLDAAKLTSGVLAMARLATGTPDGTKFVRDDGTLAVPSGSGAGASAVTVTRSLSTTLNDTIELGTFTGTGLGFGATGHFRVTLTSTKLNFNQAQAYFLAPNYNETGGAWQRITPDLTSGPNGPDNDMRLEIAVAGSLSTGTCAFRIVRTAGSVVGDVRAVIEYFGDPTSLAWAASSTTGTSSASAYTGARLAVAGAAPTGAAGGALAGTYPNPTIASSVSLPGSPTTTTQTPGDNSTKVSTTAYADAILVAARAYTDAATGGSSGLTLDTPPTNPSASDDEFSTTQTGTPSGWTGVNWAGLTTSNVNTTKPGALWVENPQNGSGVFLQRHLLKAIPAGDFTIVTEPLQTSILPVAATTNRMVGLALADGTTAGSGNQLTCMIGVDSSGFKRFALKYAGFTAGSIAFTGAINSTGDPRDRFVRMRRSGTTYFFAWSPDLRSWYEGSVTAAILGFTPTYMGVMVRNDATGFIQQASFDFFRYANSATAVFGWGVP